MCIAKVGDGVGVGEGERVGSAIPHCVESRHVRRRGGGEEGQESWERDRAKGKAVDKLYIRGYRVLTFCSE